ncbi:MAG: (2Fe-2S)-binding protein [Chloroflexi bacterium]|nr:(2Fe-2S)-binding protein [Chloroflexota bacterium]
MILHVNGRRRRVRARADQTLLEVLRDELKLAGVREACGVGMCGACTVLLDGKPISSCLVLAGLVDATNPIVTMEGLPNPDRIQEAFIEHTAFQCSYCTPGFVLATHALLAESPHPGPDEIRAYLAGNLCRCSSYLNIESAILSAARPKD